jgi:hypothetical protein
VLCVYVHIQTHTTQITKSIEMIDDHLIFFFFCISAGASRCWFNYLITKRIIDDEWARIVSHVN